MAAEFLPAGGTAETDPLSRRSCRAWRRDARGPLIVEFAEAHYGLTRPT